MKAETQKKSFARFFRKEYAKLLNYVKKNIEERFFNESPEDMIQDVALNLLNKLDVDLQIENFAAYTYRSLKNKIIDENRKVRKSIPIENLEKHQQDNLLNGATTDESFDESSDIDNIDYELLYDAISLLKPDEQAIIMSTEFEGKTFGELSERWNIPIGTLLSRKHRALAKLLKILTKTENKKTNDYGNERELSGKKTLAL